MCMEDKQMIEPGLAHCRTKGRLNNTESRKTSLTCSISCWGYKNQDQSLTTSENNRYKVCYIHQAWRTAVLEVRFQEKEL